MSEVTRVFHPNANAWQDVPSGAVAEWEKAGWQTAKPEHVDDSGALPPSLPYVAQIQTVEQSDVEATPDEGASNLSSLTIPELSAYAAENGIDLGDATKKADIIAAIEAAPAS